MTHLEGFLLDGGRVCFTDATLRPAGARIGPMLGFACDVDPYRVWARVAVDGCFDGPWERRYAVGTVFLRGVGRGQVERVEGLEEVRRRVGDAPGRQPACPGSGVWKSRTYTGRRVHHGPAPRDGGGGRVSWNSLRTRCGSLTLPTMIRPWTARVYRCAGRSERMTIASIAGRPGMMTRCRASAKADREGRSRSILAPSKQGEAP